MKLVIAGATGFIGSALTQRLRSQDHKLVLLSREMRRDAGARDLQWLHWEAGLPGPWERCVDGADGVINLAGEPIAAQRWSARHKDKIEASRIETTRALVQAIARAKEKPKFLINASAVGYYGHRGDETLNEESAPGNDFLARVCVAWEEEANQAEAYGVRVTLLRTGVVLGKGQGALQKMVPPFKFFAGGPLGSGRQWFPWIHIDDEIGIIMFLAQNKNARGSFNGTAPNPVTMKEFCKSLGSALHRPSWAPVPAPALKLLLGEMSAMLLNGQRALPRAAQNLGYPFHYPTIREALASLHL